MKLIYLFTASLISGLVISQIFDLESWHLYLTLVADVILAYIMMEVGLELSIDKKNWKSYIKDYGVAATAAGLPWIFCFLYFLFFFKDNTWEEKLLIARFAAPTSSGILFSMLAAAGLAMTWLFRKVQILAILDDVDTILLLIPLQFLLGGSRYALLSVIGMIVVLIFLAWRYLHQLRLPSGRLWLFSYAILLTALLHWASEEINIELEILLPAFVIGCLLYNPHDPKLATEHVHEHAFIEPEVRPFIYFDRGLKVIFMFCVGLLVPKIPLGSINPWVTTFHVLMITILSNIGKCFPMFVYKDEATFKERAAVSISMFPRGEVGAGILVLAIQQGASGYATTVAGYSLALNLLLTGVFIAIAVRLINRKTA